MMTRRSFRFRPPAVEPTAELAWLLDHAFGPAQAAIDDERAPGAFELARRLALAPRIAHRERGRSARSAIDGATRAERSAAAVRELLFEEALDAVEEAARTAGATVAALKGRGLVLAGHADPGTRPSGDLDLLLPHDAIETVEAGLLAAGATRSQAGDEEQHRPALLLPSGVPIELHPRLFGVRLDGRRSASWEELDQRGLLEAPPRPDRWPSIRVPARAALAAHAAVHVLAQHAFTGRFPGWLLIADLLDLGLEAPAAWPEREVPAAWREAYGWIGRDVSPQELGAALALTRAVADGHDPLRLPADELAGRLARHFVANALDDDYATALKARWLEAPLSDRPSLAARLRLLARTFVPPPRRGDGAPPAGALRRAGRWIARPFVLAGRMARALAARRRSR